MVPEFWAHDACPGLTWFSARFRTIRSTAGVDVCQPVLRGAQGPRRILPGRGALQPGRPVVSHQQRPEFVENLWKIWDLVLRSALFLLPFLLFKVNSRNLCSNKPEIRPIEFCVHLSCTSTQRISTLKRKAKSFCIRIQ